MQEAIWPEILLSCGVVLCALMWTPVHLAAANDEGFQNAFFAFDNGVGRGKWTPREQAKTLKKLGYAGIGYTGIENLTERLKAFKSQDLEVFSLYVPCYPDRMDPFSPQLKEALKLLEGTRTMLWLTVQGESNDGEAATVVAEIADAADKHGVKVALYPHYGFYIATARHAVRLVNKVDRNNVGVTINLCHELRAGNEAELDDIIKEAAPYLYLVSINGADRSGGWEKLIKTLDQGEFDVLPFLKKLNAAGYTGPIGLQCYNVKGDQRENLRISMQAWRKLCSHAGSEKERQ